MTRNLAKLRKRLLNHCGKSLRRLSVGVGKMESAKQIVNFTYKDIRELRNSPLEKGSKRTANVGKGFNANYEILEILGVSCKGSDIIRCEAMVTVFER